MPEPREAPMTPKLQRQVFGEALVELGKVNPRLVVLDADVSSSTQTKLFAGAFPERFFNVGIAEANMLSTAAGLASCGFVPVVSTFALFMCLRAGDQLRAQVAYPKLHVIMAGGYAGLSDYADGASHQSVEDIAVMRAIPGITVIVPSDVAHTAAALAAGVEHDGPVYLRLSREAVPVIHQEGSFLLGRGVVLAQGSDVTLVACGSMVSRALAAARELKSGGVSARVIDMHAVKPLDVELVAQAAREAGALVTIEEHSVIGGLGSAVCEALAERCPVPVVRCGIPDRFGESGAYDEILARAGLDVPSIVTAAGRACALKRRQAS